MTLLLLFVLGLVYDAAFVLWSYYVERYHILRASLMSMCIVGVGLLGIKYSISDWKCAVADILGCGCGTALMVYYKKFNRDP